MPDPSLTNVANVTIEDTAGVRIVRHWHKNGRLVGELRFERRGEKSFVYHGESRQWNADGQLIGSFTATNGTGTFRQWFENGQLCAKIPMVDGHLTGLQRCWDEMGDLVTERFWYRDKPVARKRYRELQATDSAAPQYSDEAFDTVAQKRKTRGRG